LSSDNVLNADDKASSNSYFRHQQQSGRLVRRAFFVLDSLNIYRIHIDLFSSPHSC